MEPFVHDVEIESITPAGDGVARVGRQRLAVPFTIPGERVRLRVTATGTAELIEVLHPSPHRVAAPCPHFGPAAPKRSEGGPKRGEGGPCGGCTWQHIAYPEQLRLKTALVDSLVRAAMPAAPAARPMIASTPVDAPWGYRHNVHFVFDSVEGRGRGPRPLVMGHYVRGTRRVLPVRECPVHDPRGNAVAFDFHAAFRRARVEAERGGLRALAVRVGAGTEEMMTTLVVSKDADRRVREATRTAMSRQGPSTSLHVNLHARRDAFIFGRETRRIAGPERMREVVGGASFLISPTAFFQTNVRAAEILVQLVSAEVPPEARVLDLYAGAGLFALPLARAGLDVTAVEENRLSVADGEASVRLNRIPAGRCRFIAGSVESALKNLSNRHFHVIVLDPPREGCEALVLQRVFGRLQPARGIYVSCNPEALARDLALIVSQGYTIRSLQPVDMFPHTAHIETIAVLDRAEAREKR